MIFLVYILSVSFIFGLTSIKIQVMQKLMVIIFLFLFSINANAQTRTEKKIIALLKAQDECWNRGDIEGFMDTYWNSDSLMFIGKSGVTYGWQNTMTNYKKGYPDTTAMGKLTFTLIDIRKLSGKYYHVTGRWKLNRSIGDLQGHFTLLLRKIKGVWKIVSDHSS